MCVRVDQESLEEHQKSDGVRSLGLATTHTHTCVRVWNRGRGRSPREGGRDLGRPGAAQMSILSLRKMALSIASTCKQRTGPAPANSNQQPAPAPAPARTPAPATSNQQSGSRGLTPAHPRPSIPYSVCVYMPQIHAGGGPSGGARELLPHAPCSSARRRWPAAPAWRRPPRSPPWNSRDRGRRPAPARTAHHPVNKPELDSDCACRLAAGRMQAHSTGARACW